VRNYGAQIRKKGGKRVKRERGQGTERPETDLAFGVPRLRDSNSAISKKKKQNHVMGKVGDKREGINQKRLFGLDSDGRGSTRNIPREQKVGNGRNLARKSRTDLGKHIQWSWLLP